MVLVNNNNDTLDDSNGFPEEEYIGGGEEENGWCILFLKNDFEGLSVNNSFFKDLPISLKRLQKKVTVKFIVSHFFKAYYKFKIC